MFTRDTKASARTILDVWKIVFPQEGREVKRERLFNDGYRKAIGDLANWKLGTQQPKGASRLRDLMGFIRDQGAVGVMTTTNCGYLEATIETAH